MNARRHNNLADASLVALANAIRNVCDHNAIVLVHLDGALRRGDREQLVAMWRMSYAEGGRAVRSHLTSQLDAGD